MQISVNCCFYKCNNLGFLYAFYPSPIKNDNMKYLCIGLSSFLLILKFGFMI